MREQVGALAHGPCAYEFWHALRYGRGHEDLSLSLSCCWDLDGLSGWFELSSGQALLAQTKIESETHLLWATG